ncbi:FAD-binding and (Fe-S)-binding domain-containing protein [Reyranella sp.]|uniref:FAD-binding and (Fe-S)-binding domain-containing protein n=1 Tax=Reyranella sp. TaxID=1929291 RepID=UPI0025E9F617|nr:FAD-binding and (Fe-S)-binding domain-containing protein [Reyranella sp.]
MSTLEERLRDTIKGEVLFDRASRGRYSTDASIYQVEPVGIVVPRDETDLALALDVARDAKAAILPRGAGTSQCGQTVGEALVVDFSKHMRNVVGFDKDRAEVTVQPGVVLDQLNAWLKPHGLWYPVDVSTSAQCTLGGMAGNNSCGSRSIRYGNMVHNVAGLDVILADGIRARFDAKRPEDMQPAVRAIADKVAALAFAERDEIERMFPKVLRRVAGYNLDIFFPQSERPYTLDNSVNMAHLLVGSEGTLAVTERLTLKLSPLPKHKTLGVVNFASFYKAMESAQHIVKLKPVAVELVDRTMIELARANPAFRPVIEKALIEGGGIGKPEAILLVEFAGAERDDQLRDLRRLVELMGDLGLPGSVVEMPEPGPQAALWEVRKAGLNIMMSMKGDGKPVSFIEDCAVPLEHLADYTQRLTEVFEKHGTRGTWYAHASVGTLHVRPILDMRNDGADKMRAIAEEASAMVREYKGAYSGEHGDGLVRSEWVSWQFGPRITKAFEAIKGLFDPENRLNPGKIVRPSRMDDRTLFRFKPGYRGIDYKPALDWSAWNVQNDPRTEALTDPGSGGDPTGGFAKAAEMCNNNGHCRKFDAGTMCPSFRVTRDEIHLTRGRANTLRLALSGQLGKDAMASDDVAKAMDLCVSCKGCKRDCPTGVDMARMKIEVRSARRMSKGLSRRDKLIGNLPALAPVARRLPWLFNLAWIVQPFLGFAKQRALPKWRSDTFLSTTGVDAEDATVVIFADTFSNNFEPEILHAARRVLEAAGHRVAVAWPDIGARPLCCGRTYLATGQVDKAKDEAYRVLEALYPFVLRDIPVIGLEPSCLLTMRDEFLALGLGEAARRTAERTFLFEEFLAQEKKAGRLALDLKPLEQKTALLHGHCHQKAFGAMSAVQEVLALVPELAVKPIESSCCGMAGSFGYEAEHYKASVAMAELSLLPAIREDKDALVVADGTSCRHQIADGANRHALHVAQVLDRALA